MKRYISAFVLFILLMPTLPVYILSATSTTVAVDPSESYVAVGRTMEVNISVNDVINLTAWQFTLYFSNTILDCINVTEGHFLKPSGGSYFWKAITNNYNSTHGSILAYHVLGNVSTSGDGVLATITFNATSAGDTTLHLSGTELDDQNVPPQPIAHNTIDASVHVQDFTLTVTVDGRGNVSKTPDQLFYSYGTVVTLNASAATGSSFRHWWGDASGPGNPIAVNMTGNKAVYAYFDRNAYNLTVTVAAGQGSVYMNNTGPYSNDTVPYHYGDFVELNASAAAGWSFRSWGGDLSGSANPSTIMITGNSNVTATFIRSVYTLTVTVAGGGSVSNSPDQPFYSYGTIVTLNASASAGWSFAGWSGNASGFGNPTIVTLTANKTVVATFVQKPTLQMSPTGKTCRMYGENFTVTIDVSDVVNVMNFTFEIHYNSTLLRYVNVTWRAWGSGTITVNEANGTITGYTSGAAANGTQSLIMIIFQVARRQVWKSAPNWTNYLTDTIFFQRASLSYPNGFNLFYARGGMNQINVGPDFAYTFSPIQGDVNNDGSVDILDLRPAGAYYNVEQGNPNWTKASPYDLNGNTIIDLPDLTEIADNFGYTYTP